MLQSITVGFKMMQCVIFGFRIMQCIIVGYGTKFHKKDEETGTLTSICESKQECRSKPRNYHTGFCKKQNNKEIKEGKPNEKLSDEALMEGRKYRLQTLCTKDKVVN